ncbi:MAG: hypothetical protein QMD14_00305 [Candidatus Aenigmarchaeota archaeon]|nr:hypothetical protein [Candidatus Aenigmarchaeota archaeon]
MNSENLRKYIFLTDNEFEVLFGAEVIKATKILDKYAEQMCKDCGGECCKRIGCGFYSAQFDSCPIYEYRPAKCRLYYCEKIIENKLLSQEKRELLYKSVKNLSEILEYSWGLEIFFEPPIKLDQKDWLSTLGIEKDIRKIVQASENRDIDYGTAKKLLKNLVQQCRERIE